MAGLFLSLYFYCSWVAIILGHLKAGITDQRRSLRLGLRSGLPPSAPTPGAPGPRPAAAKCGSSNRLLMARLKPCPDTKRLHSGTKARASIGPRDARLGVVGRVERIASQPSRREEWGARVLSESKRGSPVRNRRRWCHRQFRVWR